MLLLGTGGRSVEPREYRVDAILHAFDLLLEARDLLGEPYHLCAGRQAECREPGLDLLLGGLLHGRRDEEKSFELLAHGLSEILRAHGLLEDFRPRRDPLIEELLPLGHEVGRHRPLRHDLGPGLHALVHERPPERLRIDRLALPGHLEPGLRAFVDLLLPHVEELLGARVVRHGPPPCYDRAASQLETFGQQCTEAPRPAMSDMCPPGSSTYSLSVLETRSEEHTS